jgi:molybdopterin converting factor small subunit
VEPVEVTVEFYGIPRQRAGRAELAVTARTVGDVLRAVERACPGLSDLVQSDGCLTPHYLLSLSGERFMQNGNEPVRHGDHFMLLSADAGG